MLTTVFYPSTLVKVWNYSTWVSTSRSLFSPLRMRQWALRCVSGHFQDLFHSSLSRTRRAVLTPKITTAGLQVKVMEQGERPARKVAVESTVSISHSTPQAQARIET